MNGIRRQDRTRWGVQIENRTAPSVLVQDVVVRAAHRCPLCLDISLCRSMATRASGENSCWHSLEHRIAITSARETGRGRPRSVRCWAAGEKEDQHAGTRVAGSNVMSVTFSVPLLPFQWLFFSAVVPFFWHFQLLMFSPCDGR
jgi:hypothetical protein